MLPTNQQQLQQQHKPAACSTACRILGSIDWACLLITVVLGIAIAGISKRMVPVQRPFFQPDATISYQHVGNRDMHFVVALLVPFVVLVLTALAVECLCIKQGWQQRTVTLVNILLTFMATLAVVGFITELFKRLAGRLRPDFLSRCKEAQDYGADGELACHNMDNATLEDGRMSFPSGHSSCSMAVGLFAALYLLWSLHWREGGALHSALLRPARSVVARIGKDVASLGVLLVLLFDLAWPWGVALSRFRDNRHNISDVVGGLMLAACFVPVFVVRLASSIGYWAAHEWRSQEQQAEQEQHEQGQQLLIQQSQPQPQPQVVVVAPEPVLHKQASQQQHPVFPMQQQGPEQQEVQLTINSGATLQGSDAESAAVADGQAAAGLAGKAVPVVAGGAGSV